ncbi:MAG: prenyltransferase/squalene oxidase repeat-containing protein [Steroidobacteraceae bacterium]
MARAAAYIRARQSPSGGFCFYRYGSVEEPSLGDTYYAVAALRLFGIKVPNTHKTADFVGRARIFGLTYLYFSALTLDQLGLGLRISKEALELIRDLQIVIPEVSKSADASGWLESTRKTIRLQQRFAPVAPDGAAQGDTLARRLAPVAYAARSVNRYPQVAAFTADLMKRGGFGVQVNLWDTCLALSVSALLGLRPSQEMVAFVDSLQQLPFGFLMTPKSAMPSLDVVYAGVRCCEILGLAVRHRQEVIDFMLACQTTNGGFAHAPEALPNLEFTYQALKTLAILAPELTHHAKG